MSEALHTRMLATCSADELDGKLSPLTWLGLGLGGPEPEPNPNPIPGPIP